MEEILASIRKIISEDEVEGGDDAEAEAETDDEPEMDAEPESEPEPEPEPAMEAEPAPEPEPEVEVEEDDGILELTERVDEDVSDDDLLVIDEIEDVAEVEEEEPVVAAPEPEPEPEPVRSVEDSVNDYAEALADEIISSDVADRTSAVFGSLVSSLVVARQPGEGLTLEDLVREMLRPMLREWLDQNLQNIVDAKVEAEIARIAARSRR